MSTLSSQLHAAPQLFEANQYRAQGDIPKGLNKTLKESKGVFNPKVKTEVTSGVAAAITRESARRFLGHWESSYY